MSATDLFVAAGLWWFSIKLRIFNELKTENNMTGNNATNRVTLYEVLRTTKPSKAEKLTDELKRMLSRFWIGSTWEHQPQGRPSVRIVFCSPYAFHFITNRDRFHSLYSSFYPVLPSTNSWIKLGSDNHSNSQSNLLQTTIHPPLF